MPPHLPIGHLRPGPRLPRWRRGRQRHQSTSVSWIGRTTSRPMRVTERIGSARNSHAYLVAKQRTIKFRSDQMHSRLFLTGGVVAAAFIAAACSPNTGSTNPYGAPPPSAAPNAAPGAVPSPPPATPAAAGAAISTRTTRLGQVLVDSNGLTVYLFLADKGTASSCNSAACVQYWPPVLTTGAPQAATGVPRPLPRAPPAPHRPT